MLRFVIGSDTIWSTREHPFYVNGTWLKAGLLTVGMQVLAPFGNAEVLEIVEKDSLFATYNLTVEDNHNYLIGSQGLLVHNGCAEVGEMLERLGDDKPSFLIDFKGNTNLIDKFGDGVYSEKAWQKLQEFENFRKDEKFLRIATDLLPLKVKYKVQNNIFKILSENNTVLAELVSDGAGGSYFKILQKVDDVPSANQKSLVGFICKNEEGVELTGGFVKRADGSVKFVYGTAGIVTELIESTKNHLKFGDVKITIKNSQTGDVISETTRRVNDPPLSVPPTGVNVQYNVGGIHFESILSSGLAEEISGTRTLVTTLSDGTQVYKSKIRVWVQEANNGAGQWKVLSDEKTWWPSNWSDQKIWTSISEAFNNKVHQDYNRYVGVANDGTKIEMRLDDLGNIGTAYIIH